MPWITLRPVVALLSAAAATSVFGGCASSGSLPAHASPPSLTATGGRSSATSRSVQLVAFQHLTVDPGLSKARQALVLQRIRELYTFWNTGDPRYLDESDSTAFVDHTLPAGREQGRAGILAASQTFRKAVPDLRCTVADVLVSGDEVSVRQVYSGHFTGTYNGVHGHGQDVSFIAFDIQQVGPNQIVGDWHLEDNLTFLREIGAVTPPAASSPPSPSTAHQGSNS